MCEVACVTGTDGAEKHSFRVVFWLSSLLFYALVFCEIIISPFRGGRSEPKYSPVQRLSQLTFRASMQRSESVRRRTLWPEQGVLLRLTQTLPYMAIYRASTARLSQLLFRASVQRSESVRRRALARITCTAQVHTDITIYGHIPRQHGTAVDSVTISGVNAAGLSQCTDHGMG